jgi:phosphoribosylglycinamide formyltransferase-1
MIAVLLGSQGRGSNMANLIRAGREGRMVADVRLVISPKADTPAVDVARELGLEPVILPYKAENYAGQLSTQLQERNIDLICLAGYMTLFPVSVLEMFPHRVLNIHPALLPKFGGKGMYGMHVHQAVVAAGETESGATVHYVTEHYDEGAIIDQERCPVEPGDTPETLAARVLACEHRLYPRAVNKVLNA